MKTTSTVKISSVVKDIQFPTNANGFLSCLLRVDVTPELQKFECGGVGFGIGTHILDNNRLPFQVGSKLDITFKENGEIEKYKISRVRKGYTELPKTCIVCGTELRVFKDKEIVEGLMCPNLTGCVAQSTSPIYRLAAASTSFGDNDESGSFIAQYPEGHLNHLSDLKIFLTSDPNTAPRQALWPVLKAWELEVLVWKYLNKTELEAWHFWYIGFNVTWHTDPREVMQDFSKDYYLPEIIRQNIDRVAQLIKFFDHWGVKTYVGKTNEEK